MRGGRYSLIDDGALVAEGGRVAWVGPRSAAPRAAIDEVIDAHGALATPALIDCHTHLVYAGHRADEFEQRLAGRSYEEIARAGGGIASTVRATRAASEEALVVSARRRLQALMAEGVRTVEIKSGYGLDLDNEMKCLRVARRMARSEGADVRATYLALHAVPPEYRGREENYVDFVCREALPQIADEALADAVDAFCERIAFSAAQVRRVFEAARSRGLRVKLHADQLSDGGGAALAAEFGALSADHVEYTDDAGLDAMAASGTVAVLLPVAFYVLKETRRPPIAGLRARGIPMAVATDCNPGTAPCSSLLTAMNMACTQFGLTPEEALAGATLHAARALGLEDRGSLEAGKQAKVVLWDADTPAQLAWMVAGQKPLRVLD